jgi:hypothetical protein
MVLDLQNETFDHFIEPFRISERKQMSCTFNANVGIRVPNRQYPIAGAMNVQRGLIEYFRADGIWQSTVIRPVEHHSEQFRQTQERHFDERPHDFRSDEPLPKPRNAQQQSCKQSG